MNTALQELQKLTEAAGDLIATCEVMRGRHPEDDDIATHEDWAEVALIKAFKSAKARIEQETQA